MTFVTFESVSLGPDIDRQDDFFRSHSLVVVGKLSKRPGIFI